MCSDKSGSYVKSVLKDDSKYAELEEHKYLIREIWYKLPGDDQNIQLREIEAEYPDGDLHHYFVLNSIDQDIPDEWKAKYIKCEPCRPKIMEYLYRYHQLVYNAISYNPQKKYQISSSTLFRCRNGAHKFIVHPDSPFANREPTDLEDCIMSYRAQGLFPLKFVDPRDDMEGFERQRDLMEAALMNGYQ
eukprot:NODE_587_length_5660_cov_0.522748.p3 type:complete len:189 gc:universal NODE_587_length_5660_cov_0.522748:4286-3720(-)